MTFSQEHLTENTSRTIIEQQQQQKICYFYYARSCVYSADWLISLHTVFTSQAAEEEEQKRKLEKREKKCEIMKIVCTHLAFKSSLSVLLALRLAHLLLNVRPHSRFIFMSYTRSLINIFPFAFQVFGAVLKFKRFIILSFSQIAFPYFLFSFRFTFSLSVLYISSSLMQKLICFNPFFYFPISYVCSGFYFIGL